MKKVAFSMSAIIIAFFRGTIPDGLDILLFGNPRIDENFVQGPYVYDTFLHIHDIPIKRDYYDGGRIPVDTLSPEMRAEWERFRVWALTKTRGCYEGQDGYRDMRIVHAMAGDLIWVDGYWLRPEDLYDSRWPGTDEAHMASQKLRETLRNIRDISPEEFTKTDPAAIPA